MRHQVLLELSLLALLSSANPQQSKIVGPQTHEWPAYGGGSAQLKFSPLKQINRENVGNLKVAWTYPMTDESKLEASPIVIGGVLYGITPTQKIFALNAATGAELWKFDSGIVGTQPDRGLAYWEKGSDKRILAGVMNFLYALDARTGKPIPEFGNNGRIDLCNDLGRVVPSSAITITSPGIVYKNLIILGAREPESLPSPPGDIRAYDVVTGKLQWSFHTIPHPGEYGYDTWPKNAWTYSGGANNWAGMALDEQRGVVYVPTGSASSDFYGANRLGDDLFANSLIALNAATGERIWHFQTVRHDLWDRDLPAPPVLLTVKHGGRMIDAVAQTTKSGYIYLFDRTNGQPLFPIRYQKYPQSDVPGEKAAELQPLPSKPAPFARQRLTEEMLTNRTPEAHKWAVEHFRTFRSEGQFLPLTVDKPTVIFPGFDGGAEWGGPAVDPDAGVMYVNANDLAWTGALTKTSPAKHATGRTLYLSQCAGCHRDDREGAPPQFPSLVDVVQQRTPEQVMKVITHGQGRMPSFSLTPEELSALLEFLSNDKDIELAISGTPAGSMEYRFTGYRKFLDPDGYPAVEPPWGTLSAVNLNNGKYLWKVPLGEYPELATKGIKNTGTENYGGPIVTAGGLVFIGATWYDHKFRAFDKETGKLLWEFVLPSTGIGTPVTYEAGGRQYVVIATGWSEGLGGTYVAFALPEATQ